MVVGLSDDLNLGAGLFDRLGWELKEGTKLTFKQGKVELTLGNETSELISSMRMEEGGIESERGRKRVVEETKIRRNGSLPKRKPQLKVGKRTRCKANSLTFVSTGLNPTEGKLTYVHPMTHEGATETVGAVYRRKDRVAVLNSSSIDVILEEGQSLGTYEELREEDCDPEKVFHNGGGEARINRVANQEKEEDTPEVMQHKDQIIAELGIEENTLLKERPDVKQKVIKLIHQYWTVFGEIGVSTGCTDLTEFDIKLKEGAVPHRAKVRPLNPAQMDSLKDQMETWLEEGVVEPSESPWAAALVPARKKGGKIRWAVDYRILNSMTIADSFPLPSIEQNLERLSGAKVFSTLDAAAAYNVIPVSAQSRPLLAFITPMGLYHFKRMPFGPRNSGACYARFIEGLLSRLRSPHVCAYLDDVLIYTQDVDRHVQEFEDVLKLHAHAGIKLRPGKTFVFRTEVDYLGFRIGEQGVGMQEEYIERIRQWPIPTSVKALTSFLGFVGYYRSFIKQFAQLTAKMNEQRKNKELEWTEEMSKNFHTLKSLFETRPIRSYPRYDIVDTCPFQVTTDWSATAMGAVLSQVQDGQERMIATAARKCSRHEQNYGSVKGELACVIFAVRKWEHLLRYKPWRLNTDSAALKFLKNLKTPSGIWYRWVEELGGYQFEVVHRKGRENTNADALSRSDHHPEPSAEELAEQENEYVGALREAVKDLGTVAYRRESRELQDNPLIQAMDESIEELTKENLVKIQKTDSTLSTVRKWVETGKRPEKRTLRLEDVELKVLHQNFGALQLKDDLLYFTTSLNDMGELTAWRVVLPRDRMDIIFKWSHAHLTAGHFGVSGTLRRAQRRFFAVGMTTDLRRMVIGCQSCLAKRTRIETKTGTHHPVATGYPGQELHIDLVGPLPTSLDNMRYILSVEDGFTKHAWCYAIPNKYAATVATCLLERHFAIFGLPETIKSDNGGEFVNGLLEELADRLRLGKSTTPVYNPNSNSVERFHRTLNALLRVQMEREDVTWNRFLPAIMMAYNSKVHSSTGVTPFMATYGHEMRLPADLVIASPESDQRSIHVHLDDMLRRIQKIYRYMRVHLKSQIRRNASTYLGKTQNFKDGDKVWYLCPRKVAGKPTKLTDAWLGPYKVVKRINDVIYKIEPHQFRGPSCAVHEQRLIPCTKEMGLKSRIPENLRIEDDGDETGEELRQPDGDPAFVDYAVPIRFQEPMADIVDILPSSGTVLTSQQNRANRSESVPEFRHGLDPGPEQQQPGATVPDGDTLMQDDDPDLGAGPSRTTESTGSTQKRPDRTEELPGRSSKRYKAMDATPQATNDGGTQQTTDTRSKRLVETDSDTELPLQIPKRVKVHTPGTRSSQRIKSNRIKSTLQQAIQGDLPSGDEQMNAIVANLREEVEIVVSRDSDLPRRGTDNSAAWDIWSAENMAIPPQSTRKVPLKLKAAIPELHFLLLTGRSGLALKGISCHPGIIDSDYRGCIHAILTNTTTSEFRIAKGQRVAQALVLPVVHCTWSQQDALPSATSTHVGFGSTGSGSLQD